MTLTDTNKVLWFLTTSNFFSANIVPIKFSPSYPSIIFCVQWTLISSHRFEHRRTFCRGSPYLYWEVVYITRRASQPPQMFRTCGRCIWSSGERCRSWGPVGPPDNQNMSMMIVSTPEVYLISFRKCDNFQSKCKEGTIKKSVHKKHLAYK